MRRRRDGVALLTLSRHAYAGLGRPGLCPAGNQATPAGQATGTVALTEFTNDGPLADFRHIKPYESLSIIEDQL